MWINLAQKHKKTEPDYQLVEAKDVPATTLKGVTIRHLAGEGSNVKLITPAFYLDVSMVATSTFEWDTPKEYQGFIYLYQGQGHFGPEKDSGAKGQLLVLGPGDHLTAQAGPEGAQFIMALGQPLGEPIRWNGPYVD